ncbi:excalibur calcium-binding domain-containing protein [Streptococcus moroccensis]|uniref:Excalibur calcium-binding domain-containing protein n=1 Tax=Streptococcus moroccensis TaxID=1451356 RepID=A0ABT9YS89_9STRE|nr:excalibur calcium-binding domain-containing protein [Streptococcus moroccensis]MDQ0222183.1 hypothetical protein [Streptococcus moroccensis]
MKKWFLTFVAVFVGFLFQSSFNVSAVEASTVEMYRLYNPNSGEHFYTRDGNEKNHLVNVGWHYEGIGWIAPLEGEDVYRLYNPNAGDHHYTLSAFERDHLIAVGWRYEGLAWKSGGHLSLHRLYNPNAISGAHHYTLSAGESNQLASIGWHYEGLAWNAVGEGVPYVAPQPSTPSQPTTSTQPYYKNCDEVKAAGAAPLYRGDLGYGPHLDRDGDGVACELVP